MPIEPPADVLRRRWWDYESATISPANGDPPVGSGPLRFDALSTDAVRVVPSENHPDGLRIFYVGDVTVRSMEVWILGEINEVR